MTDNACYFIISATETSVPRPTVMLLLNLNQTPMMDFQLHFFHSQLFNKRQCNAISKLCRYKGVVKRKGVQKPMGLFEMTLS